MSKIHHHPPKPHPPAPKAPPPPKASAPDPVRVPKMGPKAVLDAFHHLDRNHNHHIDRSDLAALETKVPQDPGTLRGDRNKDGQLSLAEFTRALKHAPKKPSSSGQPARTHELHATFTMPKGQSATLRTHASGMVLGRVQAGDRFVVSHVHGNWAYGHVKGHPDRKGWVQRSQLPHQHRAPTAHERAEGTRNPVNLKDRAGLEYYTGTDKLVMQYFQQDLHIQAGKAIGYTTPVRPKDPNQPITVYANYPCNDGSVLKRDGKAVQIPKGEDVKFRYTPDGKHAVVLVDQGKGRDGIWSIVPIDQLDIPDGTMGARTPAHRITHAAA